MHSPNQCVWPMRTKWWNESTRQIPKIRKTNIWLPFASIRAINSFTLTQFPSATDHAVSVCALWSHVASRKLVRRPRNGNAGIRHNNKIVAKKIAIVFFACAMFVLPIEFVSAPQFNRRPSTLLWCSSLKSVPKWAKRLINNLNFMEEQIFRPTPTSENTTENPHSPNSICQFGA